MVLPSSLPPSPLPGGIAAGFTPPQMMTHFLSRFQPGTVIGSVDLQTLRSALTLVPDSPSHQRMAGYVEIALKEMESSAAAEQREMIVSDSLNLRIQMIQPYLEERVASPLAVSAPQVVAQLRALIAPSGQTPLPAAARLAGGIMQLGRRGRGYLETNAVLRYLQKILTMEQDVPLPETLEVAGHRVEDRNDPVFAQKLEQIFGEGVTPQIFLNVIRLIPGYRYMNLYIHANDRQEVTINGVIVPELVEEPAGAFNIIIPPMPAEDDTWAAIGQHFFINHAHRMNGLGGNLLLPFAAFLAFLQIDGLDAPARTNGRAYWASRRFELKNHRALEDLKRQLAQYVISYAERNGFTADQIRDLEMQIASIRDVGQIADFKIGEDYVGYTFLEKVIAKALDLRFQLKFNYFGWLYLIPKDKLYPPEWDELPEEVRQSLLARFEREEFKLNTVMLSDDALGHFMANWVAHEVVPVAMYRTLSRRAVGEGRSVTAPSSEEERAMRSTAAVLNMLHRLKAHHVEYFFKRYVSWASLATVIESIRDRGIAVDYEIPNEGTVTLRGK